MELAEVVALVGLGKVAFKKANILAKYQVKLVAIL